MSNLGACLQLDVGNSSAKWRLLQAGTIVARGKAVLSAPDSMAELLSCSDSLSPLNSLDHIWVSSVTSAQAERELTDILVDRWGVQPWFARAQATTDGLVNSYADPSRMGVDRWLAMLAARKYVEGRICVVDAGSALTLDIVNERGMHEGGYIIPGPHLMERALLLDTDRVRFDDEVDYALCPGKSTAEAVRHGVALAQAGAVTLLMARLSLMESQFVFCGGGGEVLQQMLNGVGVFAPDLVFEGLEILLISGKGIQ